MLYFYSGTDREKARAALNAAIEKQAKAPPSGGVRIVRVTDASQTDDLRTALAGNGMFGGKQIVILDGTFANEEMRAFIEAALPRMKVSDEKFFILEEKPDAVARKLIEKYAEKSERFDAAKAADKGGSIFAMANALRRSDKKALWVGLQRELLSGKAPEAIHGVLFWGAKDMFLKSRAGAERDRAKKLLAYLAELPHEARRKGVELEYALERFVLSGA